MRFATWESLHRRKPTSTRTRKDGTQSFSEQMIGRMSKAEKRLMADLHGQVRRLTKAEIARQYPPEKVAALQAKADSNRRANAIGAWENAYTWRP